MPKPQKSAHAKLNLQALPQHSFYADALDPTIKDGDKRQCQICLVDYVNGDNIMTLLCTHMFHKECISDWLTKRNGPPECPICKVDQRLEP